MTTPDAPQPASSTSDQDGRRPLRRALVTGSDLPYPEGVAAAEVLKVGDSHGAVEENRRGLHVIVAGGLASAAMALLARGWSLSDGNVVGTVTYT